MGKSRQSADLVSDNNIFIDIVNDRVGIGTTVPVGQFHVKTGPAIVGTSLSTGTASQNLQVTGGAYFSGDVGIGTTTPTSKLTVKGNTSLETLNVSGVSTLSTTNINGNVTITGVGDTSLLVNGNARVTGILTVGTASVTLDESGNVNTIGIITATSFYGDGQYLQNVTSGVGVATVGGTVGTGATILDFRGAGISTVTVSAGIATVNITGGSVGDAYYRQVYSPTGVQTSFSFVNGYTSGYLDVYHNGAKLVPTLDYTATDGVNFSLITPAQSGDNVEAVGYRVTSVAIVNGSVNSLIVSGIATVVGDTNLQSNLNVTGVVTATSFYGNGSGLTGLNLNRYLSIGSRVGIVTVDTYSGIFTVFGRNSNTNVPI